MTEKQSRFEKAVKKYIINYFKGLNDMQIEAVLNIHGPLLILAGAGSGKTTVLVNRIKYMLKFGNAYYRDYGCADISDDNLKIVEMAANGEISGDELLYAESLMKYEPISPYNILAITFTNKAANELKERISAVYDLSDNSLQASTFHSACVRILRRKIHVLGYTNDFAIYDTEDSVKVMKDSIEALNFDTKHYVPKALLSDISSIKEKMQTPDEYLSETQGNFHAQIIGRIYSEYQKRLISANALDFDDIIFLTVKLFKEFPDILETYRNIFKYIMVDEYQDTNIAQYQLISLLSKEHKNLCVVGDDDQSIYGFRGATIENILNFENEFDRCKVVKLEQNYRSTSQILDAANNIILHNKGRKSKKLWTAKSGGENIIFYKSYTDKDEIFYITNEIRKHIIAGGKYSDCAILYRMNAQSAGFERVFIENGIPYRIYGGLKFFGRKEIKDITAYLNLINNPKDSVRFSRIINVPKRGLGNATASALNDIAMAEGLSPLEVCERASEYAKLHSKAAVLESFAKMISELKEIADSGDLGALFDELVDKTNYDAYINEDGPEQYEVRRENILELKSMMTSFTEENVNLGLAEFLENIALYTDLDEMNENDDCVVLMTIHSAKGLEFDNVFLPAMEEGIFPSRQSIFNANDIEEERRLAYVAVTRAKKRLYITCCGRRMLFGNTMSNPVSRFVEEIPSTLMNKTDMTARRAESISGGYFSRPQSKTGSSSARYTSDLLRRPEKVSDEQVSLDYTVGDTVNHRAFGRGMVISLTPMANDMLVEVVFEKVGTKKIMAKFAKLEKV